MGLWPLVQASSIKHQATKFLRRIYEAPSSSRYKLQASSPKRQASSLKPQAASSLIREPWKSFTSLGPRASAKIKVLCGWATCHAIWCGENLSLLARVIFNSTVKNVPEVLYPNRSGMPSMLRFSILFQIIRGVFCLSFLYNLASGPMRFLG